MAQKSLKDLINEEYIKCAKDPVYFMKKYCWIQHPTRGRVQFNLYPFQEGTLRLLQKHGHQPIVLLGGGTTRIGDPSGKDKTRTILNEVVIEKNMEELEKQHNIQ